MFKLRLFKTSSPGFIFFSKNLLLRLSAEAFLVEFVVAENSDAGVKAMVVTELMSIKLFIRRGVEKVFAVMISFAVLP